MPTRTQTLATGMVLALATLAGCGAAPLAGRPGPETTGGPIQLAGHVEPLRVGAVTTTQVAAADTAFGFALFDRLCRATPGANVTLSPASAAQALGMLDAGAGGHTRTAVSRVLHLPAWSPALVAALHAQTAALDRVSQITVTNHVWEQTGLTPSTRTLDDLKTAYAADLEQVDFAAEPSTTESINSVISHDTKGLIPALFEQPFDAATQTVLANAISLDAKWQQPFPDASPGRFTTAAGLRVTTPLMDGSEGDFATRGTAGWQSVVLPYTGGDLQAVAVLSPAGGPACATPTPAILRALTSGAAQDDGVVLPKLDLSADLALTRPLAALGLPLSGDYSGLGSGDREISQVVQKVVIKVDQSGTKAAAATGVAIASSARVASQVVTFDRPFLLMLDDTATGTPLFLTRVADPSRR